jgi:biopolymer transport protein ExbD
MSSLYTKRRRRPEINLVPLIDVLVMLIFFAFVTMQFKSITTMNLTLPKVETAGKSELKDSLSITITKEGEFTIQAGSRNIPVKLDDIEKIVGQIGNINKDVTVLIRSDENTPLRYITGAMDACRKNGMNKIRLQSR